MSYLSKISWLAGCSLLIFMVLLLWRRRKIYWGSVFLGMVVVVLSQLFLFSIVLSVIEQAVMTSLMPGIGLSVKQELMQNFGAFSDKVKREDPDWWKKFGEKEETALVLVDEMSQGDLMKRIFPALINGTGVAIEALDEWFSSMRSQCDRNHDGQLGYDDMQVYFSS
eukprot:TRINITY_DN8923_c0_g1_i2.p1 TRINITY_DN8923_c0_g1~~TRINITY_DN8923_c0_g1_i2.p1  ORF type:complete len:167 (+),score=26.65 TRINITY_DN8923_c0_g1_i2:148-648(+)